MKNIENVNKRLIYVGIFILMSVVIMLMIGIFCGKTNDNNTPKEIGELVGHLTIDSINLNNIDVRLGTNKETLREAIGLYDSSVNLREYNGNICMYSHCTGEEKSYFQNIRNLKIGDGIEYVTNGEKRKYVVQQMELLDNNKVDCTNPTKENKLTLITEASKNTTISLVIQASELVEKRIKIANVEY